MGCAVGKQGMDPLLCSSPYPYARNCNPLLKKLLRGLFEVDSDRDLQVTPLASCVGKEMRGTAAL